MVPSRVHMAARSHHRSVRSRHPNLSERLL
ncbi:hypothetical protein CT19431_60055 [Cupriavidus taiwanensis]|nr:hypothetical protein CT19431_60055 [Cupriavidus taiwanensis]